MSWALYWGEECRDEHMQPASCWRTGNSKSGNVRSSVYCRAAFPELFRNWETPGWLVECADYQAPPMEILGSWDLLVNRQHTGSWALWSGRFGCVSKCFQRSKVGCLPSLRSYCWLHRGGDSWRGGMGTRGIPSTSKGTLVFQTVGVWTAWNCLGCWEHWTLLETL